MGLKVCAFVDFMGTWDAQGNQITPEDEYREIEATIRRWLPGRSITFKTDIGPHELKNMPCDLYIFDWGGACMGNNMLDSYLRDFINQAQEKPNTLFIVWSSFCTPKYLEELHYSNIPNVVKIDAGRELYLHHGETQPNVLLIDIEVDFERRFKEWFGLEGGLQWTTEASESGLTPPSGPLGKS